MEMGTYAPSFNHFRHLKEMILSRRSVLHDLVGNPAVSYHVARAAFMFIGVTEVIGSNARRHLPLQAAPRSPAWRSAHLVTIRHLVFTHRNAGEMGNTADSGGVDGHENLVKLAGSAIADVMGSGKDSETGSETQFRSPPALRIARNPSRPSSHAACVDRTDPLQRPAHPMNW